MKKLIIKILESKKEIDEKIDASIAMLRKEAEDKLQELQEENQLKNRDLEDKLIEINEDLKDLENKNRGQDKEELAKIIKQINATIGETNSTIEATNKKIEEIDRS